MGWQGSTVTGFPMGWSISFCCEVCMLSLLSASSFHSPKMKTVQSNIHLFNFCHQPPTKQVPLLKIFIKSNIIQQIRILKCQSNSLIYCNNIHNPNAKFSLHPCNSMKFQGYQHINVKRSAPSSADYQQTNKQNKFKKAHINLFIRPAQFTKPKHYIQFSFTKELLQMIFTICSKTLQECYNQFVKYLNRQTCKKLFEQYLAITFFTSTAEYTLGTCNRTQA